MATLLRTRYGLCLLLVSAMTGVISVGYPPALAADGLGKPWVAGFFAIDSLVAMGLALTATRPAVLGRAPRLLPAALVTGAAGVALVGHGHGFATVSPGGALSMAAAVTMPLILRQLQRAPVAGTVSDARLATATRWIAVAGYMLGVGGFTASVAAAHEWAGWRPLDAAVLLLAASAVLAAPAAYGTRAARAAYGTRVPATPTAPAAPRADADPGPGPGTGTGTGTGTDPRRPGAYPARPRAAVLLAGCAAIVLLKASDSLRLVYLPLFLIGSGRDERWISALFLATACAELAVLPVLGRVGERWAAAGVLGVAAGVGAVSFVLTATQGALPVLLASQTLYAVFTAALQSLGLVVLGALLTGGLPAGAGLFAGLMQLGSLVGILSPLLVPGYRPALFWIAVLFCAASGALLLGVPGLTAATGGARPAAPPRPHPHDTADTADATGSAADA
jgi:hypothetical protein